MIDVDEPPHAVGNQYLVRRLERHAFQAHQQGAAAGAALIGAQTPITAGEQQQENRAYPNPFRVYSKIDHSSAAARASSVAGRSTACCGSRSNRSRLSGTATGLPMMGSTISLNFAGCAVATTTQGARRSVSLRRLWTSA